MASTIYQSIARRLGCALLLVAGEHVTSLTIALKTPISRFSLTRIGTEGGASVSTWTLGCVQQRG
ncbi:MAG: hypothetical protein JO313_10475 [Verrucomicrobia bacterium]|nr:hypothetical protein [Verrucomicrobiota bacterium]MBV9644427.1 hypothetical protein [Verrucomicrobiota bacterium]